MNRLVDQVSWKHFDLPAGATTGQISFKVGTVGRDKPRGLLIAGLHGDEGPWGAWAIRKVLEHVSVDQLRGSLRVIPVANPSAEEAGKRNAALDLIPLDLNRVFPGDHEGLHSERLAALIAKHGVEDVDVVVDVHGGGNWCVNAFVAQFPGSEDLAAAVEAPFITPRQPIPNTLTGYAHGKGAKVVLIEMGGIGSLEEKWATRVAEGIERALNAAGIIDTGKRSSGTKSIVVGPSAVVRPSRGGIYVPTLKDADVGTVVEKGTELARLVDPVTWDVVETFRAPFDRTAVLLLRPYLIHVEGATPLAIIAEPAPPSA